MVSRNRGEDLVLSSYLGRCVDFCIAWRSARVWNIDEEVMQAMCNDFFHFVNILSQAVVVMVDAIKASHHCQV